MKSLPTIERDPYEIESTNNDSRIAEIFRQLFPDTPVPYEYIFELVRFLEETKVNARVLPQIIRGINNLVMGTTGKGQVIVHVQKDLMNVEIREQGDNLNIKL